MSDLREVAITSDSSGQLWNACVWDPFVGTTLMTYKGGVSNSHCLSFIGRDFLISGDAVKPLLHVWALNRQEQIQVRMVCPGKVGALAISPDGSYCVCGIEEKLHVWQVATGRLMAVIPRHFQRVTCIRFTDDTTHFASASEDGSVIIWPLCKVVSMTQDIFRSISDSAEPRYTFSDHSLAVTNIFIGKGGMRARLVTASLDGTSKIYDLASGIMLLSVVFDVGLTCVTMTIAESRVFLGTIEGKIHPLCLHTPPRSLDYHLTETEKQNVFSEHTKSITCLSVSVDSSMLLSGSLDEQVIIWDVPSMQCLRKLQHKGSITNAFFAIVPMNVFSNNLKPSLVLSSFKRRSDTENEESYCINVLNSERILCDKKSENKESLKYLAGQVLQLKSQVKSLVGANLELYRGLIADVWDGHDDDEPDPSFESTQEVGVHKKRKIKHKKKRNLET
ncbi:hypothetical protein J437_LFUL001651 [Ladona fulva]|uniref:WD repeat-containing protein 18 n=1 Tax=Ladona fulva TaxID=123851 RepID=A0A8K0K346_LADFU|nr:hypothetical protein J437_LFUL001651 [Ladona fulva]